MMLERNYKRFHKNTERRNRIWLIGLSKRVRTLKFDSNRLKMYYEIERVGGHKK